MKQTRLLMGMPITVEAVDPWAEGRHLEQVFDYFQSIDERFSTYKDTSEISAINRRELSLAQFSAAMRTVFELAEQTRLATGGYFDIERGGRYDPSGLVKGWAIQNAAELLRASGLANYYVESGGDIQMAGHNAQGAPWHVGVRHPFQPDQIVKVLAVSDGGVATSGDYVRGAHIYRPGQAGPLAGEVVSLTVIGPNIYEADRFATAAFAMGRAGLSFIDSLDGLEGYLIDRHGQATLTRGFHRYVADA
jgi:thiamine biosynthesis lipoprotein